MRPLLQFEGRCVTLLPSWPDLLLVCTVIAACVHVYMHIMYLCVNDCMCIYCGPLLERFIFVINFEIRLPKDTLNSRSSMVQELDS